MWTLVSCSLSLPGFSFVALSSPVTGVASVLLTTCLVDVRQMVPASLLVKQRHLKGSVLFLPILIITELY